MKEFKTPPHLNHTIAVLEEILLEIVYLCTALLKERLVVLADIAVETYGT